MQEAQQIDLALLLAEDLRAVLEIGIRSQDADPTSSSSSTSSTNLLDSDQGMDVELLGR
jgi:hypothetical protein